MNIMCEARGHKSGAWEKWNEGYFFSECSRCRKPLIRTSGNWRRIPRGYRVTWRSGHHRHAIASGFRRNLPLAPKRRAGWKAGLHLFNAGCIALPFVASAAQRLRPTAARSSPFLDFALVAVIAIVDFVAARPARTAQLR